MIEVYEGMAQQMDAENYAEYLRLICEPPTVINLLITDPSDPKVKDFIDKISMLKEQGKL